MKVGTLRFSIEDPSSLVWKRQSLRRPYHNQGKDTYFPETFGGWCLKDSWSRLVQRIKALRHND